MSENRIPLTDWIEGVRREITEAQARYHSQPADPNRIGLNLEEVTLEAQVSAETSDSDGLKVQLFVVTFDGSVSQKTSTTQKVVLKFRPNRPSGKPLTMGGENEPDAFEEA